MRRLPFCLLWLVAGLFSGFLFTPAHARPRCEPTDWTSPSFEGSMFGTCNWVYSDTPCGMKVTRPGSSKVHRSWPTGMCSLKYSRTPWAPRVYEGEQDENFMCGRFYKVCKERNSTAEGIPCGVGTERPCAEYESAPDRYECTPRNITERLNCQGTDTVLVIDVSSMGFPAELASSRVATAEQCARMCHMHRSGLCNLYQFCNSTGGGCGWTCGDYVGARQPPPARRPDLPIGAWIGIATAGAALLLCTAATMFYLCIYRPNQRMAKRKPSFRSQGGSLGRSLRASLGGSLGGSPGRSQGGSQGLGRVDSGNSGAVKLHDGRPAPTHQGSLAVSLAAGMADLPPPLKDQVLQGDPGGVSKGQKLSGLPPVGPDGLPLQPGGAGQAPFRPPHTALTVPLSVADSITSSRIPTAFSAYSTSDSMTSSSLTASTQALVAPGRPHAAGADHALW